MDLGATSGRKPRDAGTKRPAGSGPVPARTAEPSRAVAPARPASLQVSAPVFVRKGAVARFAVADPPYPGQSFKHYRDHPDYAGEVDHHELARRLQAEFDGWVLHTSAPALSHVLDALHAAGPCDWRVMSWVKPFAAFKRNVSVAYTWEPVIVKPVRKPVVSGRVVMRDFLEEADPELDEYLAWLENAVKESITMKRGLTGAKPEKVCHWSFEVAGAEPTDEFHDLYPGSGAITRAWESWRLPMETAA